MDHITLTITSNDHDRHAEDPAGTQYSMLEAQHVAYGPARFKRWDFCCICDWLWPEDKLVEYEGKKYCIPLRHYRDIEYPDMLKVQG